MQSISYSYLATISTQIANSYHLIAVYIVFSDFILYACIFSKDDRLPNLDATKQVADTENADLVQEAAVTPNKERKHFPYNITKIGYVIFSVSCYTPYCYLPASYCIYM